MPIPWSDEYNIGFKIIDEQHKEFVNILNSSYEAIKSGEMEKSFAKVISELGGYAKLHFETEEKYFSDFSYEDAEKHKKIHREFSNKINELKDRLEKENDIKLFVEIVDILENWLLDHLNDVDKKYVECFKKNGLE